MIRIFINGVLNANQSAALPNLSNAASLQLGRDACSDTPFGHYFEGQMDEVRIWSKARSSIEINADKDSELDGSEDDLIAYYDFSDGPGSNTLSDKSPNGHNGTLVKYEYSRNMGRSKY